MKKGCLTFSLTTGITLLIFVVFFLVQLSKCSNRPQFVIKNSSKNPVSIEFVYDSLDIKSIVLSSIYESQRFKNSYFYKDSLTEKSVIDSLQDLQLTEKYLARFILDSIQAYELIPMEYSDKDFMERHSLSDFSIDSDTFRKKIFKENSIPIVLKPMKSLKQRCWACGDCTCFEAQFPYTAYKPKIPSNPFLTHYPMIIKIRVINHNGQIIEITPENFQNKMKKKTIDGHEGSLIFEIR